MLRTMLTVWLTCFAFVASSTTAVLERITCETGCPDDDSDGACAPDCTDCGCCTHARPIVELADERANALALPEPRALEHASLIPPLPEPNEILHVPIAA